MPASGSSSTGMFKHLCFVIFSMLDDRSARIGAVAVGFADVDSGGAEEICPRVSH